MSSAATGGPVFVVGMNGSGTTMLADSLGRHPGLYVFPFESKLIPTHALRTGVDGVLSGPKAAQALAAEIGRSKPFWHANGKKPLQVDAGEIGAASVAGVFDALFMHMAGREGKLRWGEKSPANTEHLQLLARMFPDARFVHIIRDGRDAAQSFHRRWGFDPVHTIWRWKKTVARGRRQGLELGPGRYFELRYESLTADPDTQMRAVCDFLDLPFDPAVLASSMRHMNDDDRARAGARIVVNSGRWREYFSPAQVHRLERVAGRQLRELGYAVDIADDEDLGPRRLRLLRAKDGVNRSLAFFRDYGWRGLPMFVRVLRAASAQARSRRY